MIDFIVHYGLETFFTGIVAFFGVRLRMLHKEYHALKAGLTAILRDRIVTAYYHYGSRGNITLHGLENVNRMFQEYQNLGGNGSIQKLVEDLNRLEVVDN